MSRRGRSIIPELSSAKINLKKIYSPGVGCPEKFVALQVKNLPSWKVYPPGSWLCLGRGKFTIPR